MALHLALATSPATRRVAAALAAATVTAATVAVVSFSGALTWQASANPMGGVNCPVSGVSVGDGDGKTPLKGEQIKNAQTIIAVGQGTGVPTRGQIVAIAAALAESGLRNLNYGDRDSLGLFQMRPSMGWGTPEQILDTTYAAKKFYSVLLTEVKGWEQMSINDAAQAVERSGFPNAYAEFEAQA
ncbi:hypothetical protein LUZ28_30010, partial [Streptomyces albireticuli]